MKNPILLNELEKVVMRKLDESNFDFFPNSVSWEIEFCDATCFEEVACFLNMKDLERFSNEKFYRKI